MLVADVSCKAKLVVRLATAVVMVVATALVPTVWVRVVVSKAATGSMHPKRPFKDRAMSFALPLFSLLAITALLHMDDDCPAHSLCSVRWC